MSEITGVYRARRYCLNDAWQCWYEFCPTVKTTDCFVVVRSQTFLDTPLYPGGDFRLKKDILLRGESVYHSRHGEYFYLYKPRLGELFPSLDVLATKDFTITEAEALGWDTSKPIHQWSEQQKWAYFLAKTTDRPLALVVEQIETEGVDRMLKIRRLSELARLTVLSKVEE